MSAVSTFRSHGQRKSNIHTLADLPKLESAHSFTNPVTESQRAEAIDEISSNAMSKIAQIHMTVKTANKEIKQSIDQASIEQEKIAQNLNQLEKQMRDAEADNQRTIRFAKISTAILAIVATPLLINLFKLQSKQSSKHS